MSQMSSRASLEEEVYLRALTGRLVGVHEFEGLKRIAIISYPDRICESIAAAATVAYFERHGYGENKVKIFDYSPNIQETAKKIVSWGAEGVYLAFGGEQKMSLVNEVFLRSLDALRVAGFRGVLLLHVRSWLASKQLSTALQDKELLKWLRSLPEIRLFTADVNVRKFYFSKIRISEDGKVSLERYREENITEEHANLLKISLPPPD